MIVKIVKKEYERQIAHLILKGYCVKIFTSKRKGDEYMDFDKEMEKKFDDLFWYVLNEQTQQLNNEKEYMELNRTCQEITGTNSKIQAIIENNESVSLTKEEVELLVKYFTSCIDRMLIEQKKMFYLGGKYFYYLMKEMELVK